MILTHYLDSLLMDYILLLKFLSRVEADWRLCDTCSQFNIIEMDLASLSIDSHILLLRHWFDNVLLLLDLLGATTFCQKYLGRRRR